MGKPILCLDFDGVIHGYQSGWQGADCCPDPITPGTVEFIAAAHSHFTVAIFSSRSNQRMGIEAMRFYMKLNFYRAMEPGDADPILDAIEYPLEKPPALITIDDRALTFTGNWSDFPIDDLRAFKPWNKRNPEDSEACRLGASLRRPEKHILSSHAENVVASHPEQPRG